jgi:molybdate transport system substrate-binding protein
VGWLLAGLLLAGHGRDRTILVSAAASLTDAMHEIGDAFAACHLGVTVRFNFGASGTLERQIEQGAPVDVFASAGEKEMDDLAKAGDVAPKSRLDFAGNRLVLIAGKASNLRNWADLTKPSVRRIALPKPELVPSGRYGKETLEHRKLWTAALPKLIYANNVRQALTYVASGDVDCGIVFATDAQTEVGRVRIVASSRPRVDHEPILYPAAVVKQTKDFADASLFTTFLGSRAAQSILRARGFTPR